jgi:hypothetical protein
MENDPMIRFALEDFNYLKVGDVIYMEQEMYDYISRTDVFRCRYVIVVESTTKLQFRGVAYLPRENQAIKFLYQLTVRGCKYYHTDPLEWSDEVAALRMQLAMEGVV